MCVCEIHVKTMLSGVYACVIMLKPCYLVCVCVCNHVETMVSGVDCSCKNCVCTCINVCNNQKCFTICDHSVMLFGVHVIMLEP